MKTLRALDPVLSRNTGRNGSISDTIVKVCVSIVTNVEEYGKNVEKTWIRSICTVHEDAEEEKESEDESVVVARWKVKLGEKLNENDKKVMRNDRSLLICRWVLLESTLFWNKLMRWL